MQSKTYKLDLVKLIKFILKRCWLPILCAVIGFGLMHIRATRNRIDTYTASGTMYVYNGNPNLVNYGYTNSADLNTAVQLLDTYMVVVRSNKVLDTVTERLVQNYPFITPELIASTLSMGSVSQTGVLRVSCTTWDAQMSADICNAVLDVAPAEIIRVVNAGSIEIIDYATVPLFADRRSTLRNSLIGGIGGGLLGGAILVLLFLLNHKVTDIKEIEENYTPPVLASIHRSHKSSKQPISFRLSDKSSIEVTESYAKLRMNLMYAMAGNQNRAVAVTSSVAGEGKSTICANLAISCAMAGKSVVLVDGDMRRASQRGMFLYDPGLPGLSEVLVGRVDWHDAVVPTGVKGLRILPAGKLPPNPSELLGLESMKTLVAQLQQEFDLVLIDVPPINIVSDPLAISGLVAGCLFVTRQNYTDHREVRKALIAAELAGMNVMGFVFYGEKIHQEGYYYRKYYKKYYDQTESDEEA